MEKQARKLVLSKETLRTLDDDQLDYVVGGAPTTRGLVCVDSAVCKSGVCDSAVCRSVACDSVAICNVG